MLRGWGYDGDESAAAHAFLPLKQAREESRGSGSARESGSAVAGLCTEPISGLLGLESALGILFELKVVGTSQLATSFSGELLGG